MTAGGLLMSDSQDKITVSPALAPISASPNGEVGELCCKGPGVIPMYWNDPE